MPSGYEVRLAFSQIKVTLNGRVTFDLERMMKAEDVLTRFYKMRPRNMLKVDGLPVAEITGVLRLGIDSGGDIGEICQRILLKAES